MDKNVIIIGAGLSGLSAALSLAKKNIHVDLVSLSPAKRSPSVCAQGGINAACTKEDSFMFHAYETIKGGDFLADQLPVVQMCYFAHEIIKFMDSLGCPFNRDENGNIDFRGFGGTLKKRTAFCQSSTGQQLLYILDSQVRMFESKKKITRWENHEFIKLVKNSNDQVDGVLIYNLKDSSIHVLQSTAVVIATGGLGRIFKNSTNSMFSTGSALGSLFVQGAYFANGEFIQIHPTAILGNEKMKLITEAVRGEGGRIWVYGNSKKKIQFPDGSYRKCGEDKKPWYFLEDMYPSYKNLVPRDIASLEICKVCSLGLGVDNENQVYLDISSLTQKNRSKIEKVLDFYTKVTGDDLKNNPMKVFPAVHYSMGGLWVDWPDKECKDRFKQMTNISGVFAIGESDFLYHGANRLGANSLLSCIFSGFVAGKEVKRYLNTKDQKQRKDYSCLIKTYKEKLFNLLDQEGSENIFSLYEELSFLMTDSMCLNREKKFLLTAIEKMKILREKSKHLQIEDQSLSYNQSLLLAIRLPFMIEIGMAILKKALFREESRGSHQREDFPKRNDKLFLKTSMAYYKKEEPEIFYKDIDTSFVEPQLRDYSKDSSSYKFKKIYDNTCLKDLF